MVSEVEAFVSEWRHYDDCSNMGEPREDEDPACMDREEGLRGALGAVREDIERFERIETAASILVNVVNAIMPENSPYGCPHGKDWLNGILDDLRKALEVSKSANRF